MSDDSYGRKYFSSQTDSQPEIIRHMPPDRFRYQPCSITAAACALKARTPGDMGESPEGLRSDHYLPLQYMNQYVRKNLNVRKYQYFKRGLRPCLKELHVDGRAVVCVLGHYLYVEGSEYWSFFDNDDDPVVAVWYLKD